MLNNPFPFIRATVSAKGPQLFPVEKDWLWLWRFFCFPPCREETCRASWCLLKSAVGLKTWAQSWSRKWTPCSAGRSPKMARTLHSGVRASTHDTSSTTASLCGRSLSSQQQLVVKNQQTCNGPLGHLSFIFIYFLRVIEYELIFVHLLVQIILIWQI